MFDFCWNWLKSGCLTRLGGLECFFIFLVLFDPFSTRKIEELDF